MDKLLIEVSPGLKNAVDEKTELLVGEENLLIYKQFKKEISSLVLFGYFNGYSDGVNDKK